MLQIVSINRSDIIATSDETLGYKRNFGSGEGISLGAGERRFDDWDAGY